LLWGELQRARLRTTTKTEERDDLSSSNRAYFVILICKLNRFQVLGAIMLCLDTAADSIAFLSAVWCVVPSTCEKVIHQCRFRLDLKVPNKRCRQLAVVTLLHKGKEEQIHVLLSTTAQTKYWS
jgi:hypothetical protein